MADPPSKLSKIKCPVALIIDDEPDILSLLEISLRRMSIRCMKAPDFKSAIQLLNTEDFNLCLTDLKLPDGSGLDLVKHIQKKNLNIPVAVITAYGESDTAVAALKSGAFDYVSKPLDVEQLQHLVQTGLSLNTTATTQTNTDDFLGQSPLVENIRKMVAKVSRNQAPVHISGETGTGKELIARMIHNNGPRSDAPFVPVNCGAIPKELMESEFFGHKKGSFTGAHQDTKGLFEAANGGTLFLDEVADLPLDLQVKLLRAIQEKTIRPIGSQEEKFVDVRLISATHKVLIDMIEEGTFRQDLYYRLNVIPIEAPCLKHRREDIPELLEHNVVKHSTFIDSKKPNFTPSALNALIHYDYPGNVRELENIVERALALNDGEDIDVDDILFPPKSGRSQVDLNDIEVSIDEHMTEIETRLIEQALTKTEGNITNAAKLLGTSFRSLRYKIKKLSINSDD